MDGYKGALERSVDGMIAREAPVIEINWINMTALDVQNADRITRKLVDAGYRPDGAGVADKLRADYEAGREVDGHYIRLPQETWRRDKR